MNMCSAGHDYEKVESSMYMGIKKHHFLKLLYIYCYICRILITHHLLFVATASVLMAASTPNDPILEDD